KVEAAVLVAARGVYIRGRVPWVNRRCAVGSGFVAQIFLKLGKGTIGINTAHPNLLNGVSDAIADVVRPVLIAGIRRFRHQYAHVLRDHGRVGQLDIQRSAFSVSYYPGGESLPLALRTQIEIEGALAHPILHLIGRSIRARPRDADRIYRRFGHQIYDYPLRVQSIAFAGELAGEIGIALPIAEIGTS